MDKDILKPEGSDTYARSCGGRVARLQFAFASSARDTNHYDISDGGDVASGLGDWLIARDKLSESTATSFAEGLAPSSPSPFF